MPAAIRPIARLIGATSPTLRVKSPFGVEALSRDPEVQRAYVEDPLVFRDMTVGLGVEMLTAMEYFNAHLHELTLPTLVVHGGDDRLVPRSASEPLESLEPVSRTVYEGLRHEILNEPEWEMVVGDIVKWVNERLASDQPLPTPAIAL
jgi:acylglycerol lipase